MKRYTLLLSVFTLIFISFLGSNAQSASAWDAGCTSAGPYSILTGQLCASSQAGYYSGSPTNAYIIGCNGYSAYSTVTGQACYQPQTQVGYTFTRELGLGLRGDDVLMLQQILQNKGYSVGRLDGVYGYRTTAAVRSFQIDNRLSVTGTADSATLNILNVVSPISYPPTYYPPVPVATVPVISGVSGPQSLLINQQGIWTVVASNTTNINGTNLTYSVNWGDQPLYAYGTNNSSVYLPQQSATFSHVYSTVGTYTPIFTVTNSLGQSAQTSLSVVVGGSVNQGPVFISSLSPVSGVVGTQVTVYGTGFGYANSANTVNFGSNVIKNVYSANGTSLTFTVPTYTSPACLYSNPACYVAQTQIMPGIYPISITNTYGMSNSVNFTVTGTGSNTIPVVNYLSPNSGRVGTQVTIYGTGFTYSGNTVTFGSITVPNLFSFNGTSLTFSVPQHPTFSCFIAPCYQNFNVSVSNSNGTSSNSSVFTVIY